MKARSIGLAVALLLILSACQNFFAPQEATTYTVTYAGNGSTVGAGPTDGHKYKPGDAIAVLGNSGALTKAGFAFTAWNTKADGSGTSYAPAASFAMGNANVSLYAVWGSTYTVIYNGNGSTGGTAPADAGTYVKDATVTVLGNTGTLV